MTLLLAGCVTDADPALPTDVGVGDVSPDAADAPADADPACADDRFGPSTPDLPAAGLAPATYSDLVLCPRETDTFRLDVEPGRVVRVAVRGPQRLAGRLVDADGRVVDQGGLLSAVVPPGGLRLTVGPAAEEALGYALEVAALQPGACDETEPAGPALSEGVRVEASTCLDDVDAWRIESGAGRTLRVDAEHLDGEGVRVALRHHVRDTLHPVRIAFADLDGRGSATLRAAFPWDPTEAPGALEIHVAAAPGASGGRYSLRASVEGEPAPPIRVSGDWSQVDRAVSRDGLEAPEAEPALDIRVDLERAEDGVWLATAVTGPDGYALAGAVAPGAEVRLRAWSEAIPDRAHVVRVSPGPDDRPYSLVLAELAAEDGEVDLAVPFDAPEAPAFHIARTASLALRAVFVLGPADPPPIVFHWVPDAAPPCGSCFRTTPFPRVELSGGGVDPDHWDAPVIVHELAHVLLVGAGNDDSPGGRHDGSRVDPRLAWSEGFADFFASWVLGDPVQLDHRLTGVRVRDLETDEAFGTADGTPMGDVSEALVAAALWDLHDRREDDDDPWALLDAALIGPALNGPPLAGDSGVAGVDFLDYLDQLACGFPEIAAAVASARELPHTPACAR